MPKKLNLTDEERRLRRNAYQREWNKRNPDKVRAYCNKWLHKNWPEWYEGHREAYNERKRAARAANPDLYRAMSKKYYDRDRPAGNFGSRRRWTTYEKQRIMDLSAGDDHALARELNRSVAAIQIMRHKLGGLPTPKHWKYRTKRAPNGGANVS